MVLTSLMINVLVTVILLHCVDQFHALCVEEALSGSPAKLNKNGNKH